MLRTVERSSAAGGGATNMQPLRGGDGGGEVKQLRRIVGRPWSSSALGARVVAVRQPEVAGGGNPSPACRRVPRRRAATSDARRVREERRLEHAGCVFKNPNRRLRRRLVRREHGGEQPPAAVAAPEEAPAAPTSSKIQSHAAAKPRRFSRSDARRSRTCSRCRIVEERRGLQVAAVVELPPPLAAQQVVARSMARPTNREGASHLVEWSSARAMPRQNSRSKAPGAAV